MSNVAAAVVVGSSILGLIALVLLVIVILDQRRF
jgi:hypothetical protein